MNTRPVSVAHLVMGLVFTGIAAVWLVGELTDADTPGFEWWGPGLLVAAGVVGLVATVLSGRKRGASATVPAADPTYRTSAAEADPAEPGPDPGAGDTAPNATVTIPLSNDPEEKP